jgi:hypothetical protein
LDVRGSEAVIGQESSYRLGSSVYRLGLHASGEEEAEISNMNYKELLLLGTESQVPREGTKLRVEEPDDIGIED